MNPLTAFQVVGGVAQGLAGRSQAMGEAARADAEARLADTQALQRDTIARDELSRFLGTTKAARAANGLSSRSPNAFVLENDARKQSDRDRLIQRADDRQRAANFRASARSYRSAGRASLFTGLVNGGISIAENRLARSET